MILLQYVVDGNAAEWQVKIERNTVDEGTEPALKKLWGDAVTMPIEGSFFNKVYRALFNLRPGEELIVRKDDKTVRCEFVWLKGFRYGYAHTTIRDPDGTFDMCLSALEIARRIVTQHPR